MSVLLIEPPVLLGVRRLAVTDAHEGPVYAPGEHALYFTSVRRGTTVALRRLDLADRRVDTVLEDANVANGMALAPDGTLLVCEQGTLDRPARISRVDPATGIAETVADSWDGLPLNSPNDVVVARDGSIWFTDPSYGFLQGFRPKPAAGDHVYRIDPATGVVELAAAGFDKPNGLAFSPDESILYVGDNGAPHHVVTFDAAADGLAEPRYFAAGTAGHPDGLKVDVEGRVYGTVGSGIRIWGPDGRAIDDIPIGGAVNFCFGGLDRSTLFVTTDTAVWAVDLDTEGA